MMIALANQISVIQTAHMISNLAVAASFFLAVV